VIGWVLAATSEVFVYGMSAGLAGTAGEATGTYAYWEVAFANYKGTLS
jgi:hypothetical protein